MRLIIGLLFISFLTSIPKIAVAVSKPQQPLNSGSTDAAPYVVPDDEVSSHQTGDHKVLRQSVNQGQMIFRTVRLKLVVAADGHVISASPQEGPSESYPGAIAEAMGWKYKPFEKDGMPVVATITDYVRVLPPEEPPSTHHDFPPITNLTGVVMTLSRSGCFGACPSYSVEIHGDGTVLYKGNSSVVFTGEHRDHLPPERVTEILDAFRDVDYFSLKDKYSYPVTDCPTYTTSFQIDQVSKSVVDYVGIEAGMPQSVSDLEDTIDRAAGTRKWTEGNRETISSLKREAWNFKSREAAETLVRASRKGNPGLVRGLVSEGSGLSATDEAGNPALASAAGVGDRESVKILLHAGAAENDIMMKTQALAAAARSGDPELVRLMLQYGGDAKGWMHKGEDSKTVLMAAASSGVPEVVALILAEGPDINARDEGGHTAFWYISEASTYFDEKRHANRAEVVHLLATAGGNIDLQDKNGNAPLHTAYDADVARALIQDGANVDIRNNDGDTPLMTNSSVEAARLLVAAGANVRARNNEQKTALDLARELEPGGEWAKFLEALDSVENSNP